MKAFKAECCSRGDQSVAVAQEAAPCPCRAGQSGWTAGPVPELLPQPRTAALCRVLCLVFMKSVWIKCKLQACFELSF